MKKIAFILILTASLIAGIIFISYRAFPQKQVVTQAKMPDTNRKIYETQNSSNAATLTQINIEEWTIFKRESESKIKDEEIHINELRVQMKEQSEISDLPQKKKIASLEQQIKYMKTRLENFEKSPSNWESFKSQFSNEIDAIGNRLKDLTDDDKKQEYPK